MTENDVLSALRTRLAALPAAPPIAWPGVPFTPTAGQLYLAFADLPVSESAAGIGDNAPNLLRGILQVTVAGPSGVGTQATDAVSQAVMQHFKRGTVIPAGDGYVRVESVKRAPIIMGDAWVNRPVSITYYAYTTN